MKKVMIAIAMLITLTGALYLYWFKPWDPRIQAILAWSNSNNEFGQAVANARRVAERDGLYSKTAEAALANANRAQFINGCVSQQFKYNETTLDEFRVIESTCRRDLLAKDAEAHRLYGKDYGWEQF